MRLGKHLLNESRSKMLNLDDWSDEVVKRCKDALRAYKKGSVIWRGMYDDKRDYLYIEPSKHTRESAHTSNYYTLIIDNHPKWKKYPKRSKSVICSTDFAGAEGYGYSGAHVVLPIDGSTIGVAPEYDFWYSFQKTLTQEYSTLESMNSMLSYMYNFTTNDRLNPKTYNALVKNFKKFDVWLHPDTREKLRSDGPMGEIIAGKKYNGDLLKRMQEILDPQKNGFKTVKVGSKLPKNREVWTSGTSYLLYYDKRELLDELVKRV